MGQPIWDKLANDHDTAQLQALDSSTELWTEKIRQAIGRDDNTPIARRADG